VYQNIGTISLIAFTLLFAGCAEDVLIDYQDVPSKLIVQSRLSPDSPFSINISSSLSPVSSTGFGIPDGVQVSLFDVTGEQGPVINLYQENGLFVAPQSYPIVGHSYKIFVVAQNFETVEATTSIPIPVELDAENSRISNFTMVESEVTQNKMNVSYDLELALKTDTHRYFHFNFVQTTKINVGTAADPIIEDHAYFISPQFPNEDGFYEHHESGVLIDADLVRVNGKRTLSFAFVDYTLGEIEELGNLLIEVRAITPEYYQYFTSLSRQLISREDPFAEPIPVYNNVRDGGGNFSGFSSLVYEVTIIP